MGHLTADLITWTWPQPAASLVIEPAYPDGLEVASEIILEPSIDGHPSSRPTTALPAQERLAGEVQGEWERLQIDDTTLSTMFLSPATARSVDVISPFRFPDQAPTPPPVNQSNPLLTFSPLLDFEGSFGSPGPDSGWRFVHPDPERLNPSPGHHPPPSPVIDTPNTVDPSLLTLSTPGTSSSSLPMFPPPQPPPPKTGNKDEGRHTTDEKLARRGDHMRSQARKAHKQAVRSAQSRAASDGAEEFNDTVGVGARRDVTWGEAGTVPPAPSPYSSSPFMSLSSLSASSSLA